MEGKKIENNSIILPSPDLAGLVSQPAGTNPGWWNGSVLDGPGNDSISESKSAWQDDQSLSLETEIQ